MSKFYAIFFLLLIPAQLNCFPWPWHHQQQQQYSTPQECARECRDGEPSKTCYFKMVVEYYTTVGAACDLPGRRNFNLSDVLNPDGNQCILGDGVEKTVLSINRKIPGPSIQACLGDRLVIDVHNEAEGLEVSLHWHGIFQNGYQYYDGVPFLTQCPISSESTFRYQFQLDNSGTHWYHSHLSVHVMDGQYGSLIVRDPPRSNPHLNLYDLDLPEHVIVISDWLHQLSLERFPGRYRTNAGQSAENYLVNGRGNWTDPKTGISTNIDLSKFTVQPGKKYRFRIVAAISTVCSMTVNIENHSVLVIAQDGENIQPQKADKLTLSSGERVDFVLEANQTANSYWIQIRGLGECTEKSVQQLAILEYEGATKTPASPIPEYNNDISPGPIEYNPVDARNCPGNPNKVCVDELFGLTEDQDIYRTPDVRLGMKISFQDYNNSFGTLFEPSHYRKFFVAPDKTHLLSLVNNISFADSAGPPLAQTDGADTICGPNAPSQCTKPCACAQVYNVPLGALVEVIIYDEMPLANVDHPFHLHGYSFSVFEVGQTMQPMNPQDATRLLTAHEQRVRNGQYSLPARKDTVLVPEGGYVIVRFKANNPGWWMWHCHFAWHTATGMNVVIHVGDEDDLPPVPEGFPECHNWTPPPAFG